MLTFCLRNSSPASPSPDTLSPTTTSTSTDGQTSTATSSTVTATPTQKFFTGCNSTTSTNNQIYIPKDPSNNQPIVIDGVTISYKQVCSFNPADHTSGHNPGIYTFQVIQNSTSWTDCISQCALYNERLPASSGRLPAFSTLCSGAIYVVQAARVSSICYLQNGTTTDATTLLYGADQEIDTGVLQWPVSS